MSPIWFHESLEGIKIQYVYKASSIDKDLGEAIVRDYGYDQESIIRWKVNALSVFLSEC